MARLTAIPAYTHEDVAIAYNEMLRLIQDVGKDDALRIIADRIARLRAQVAGMVEISVVVPELAKPGDTLLFTLEDDEPSIAVKPARDAERRILWTVTGADVRRYRLQRNLSSLAFGLIVGYNESQVRHWESGRRPVPEKAARVFGLFKLLPHAIQRRYVEHVTRGLTPRQLHGDQPRGLGQHTVTHVRT